MKLNKPLIRKIRKHILEEPRRYNQGKWFQGLLSKRISPCGTQACIGGWAEYFLGVSVSSLAKSMGLSKQAFQNLCGYGDEWPKPYREQFKKARGYAARANVAGRLLNAVIRTDGKILEGISLP